MRKLKSQKLIDLPTSIFINISKYLIILEKYFFFKAFVVSSFVQSSHENGFRITSQNIVKIKLENFNI